MHSIAQVYTTLAARFKEFQSKNKAAKLGGEVTATSLYHSL